VQAALDLEEIMAIATDGLYRMDPAWQYPGTGYYPGIDGLGPYAKQDQAKARQLLRTAGYKGEEMVIVADNSFKAHLDAGTIASQQLRAAGINVKLNVMDWPTVMSTRSKPDGWNLWPLMMGIEPYEGPYNVVGFFGGKQTVQIKQDPVIEQCIADLASKLKMADRVAAVAAFQARLYDQAIAVKVGDVGIIQATRSNVANYAPYRIPRMWDCWFA
jgi:peptide/nickel transport system substrate-binding protein